MNEILDFWIELLLSRILSKRAIPPNAPRSDSPRFNSVGLQVLLHTAGFPFAGFDLTEDEGEGLCAAHQSMLCPAAHQSTV